MNPTPDQLRMLEVKFERICKLAMDMAMTHTQRKAVMILRDDFCKLFLEITETPKPPCKCGQGHCRD